MATQDTVLKALTVLSTAFPALGNKLTEDKIEAMIVAWHTVLYDVPDDLLERATLHICGTACFFPSAGELRQAAFDLVDLGADIPTAQDAWAEVSRCLRTGFYMEDERGFYQRRAPTAEDWSHPLIQRAIDGVGGWQALNDPQGLAAADRARFLEAYQVYATRDRRDRAMLPTVRQAVEQIRAGRRGQPLALPAIIRGITDRGVPVVELRALELEPA